MPGGARLRGLCHCAASTGRQRAGQDGDVVADRHHLGGRYAGLTEPYAAGDASDDADLVRTVPDRWEIGGGEKRKKRNMESRISPTLSKSSNRSIASGNENLLEWNCLCHNDCICRMHRGDGPKRRLFGRRAEQRDTMSLYGGKRPRLVRSCPDRTALPVERTAATAPSDASFWLPLGAKRCLFGGRNASTNAVSIMCSSPGSRAGTCSTQQNRRHSK